MKTATNRNKIFDFILFNSIHCICIEKKIISKKIFVVEIENIIEYVSPYCLMIVCDRPISISSLSRDVCTGTNRRWRHSQLVGKCQI